MPRHPPNALTTLNRSHCQCSSFSQPFIRTTNRPGYLLQPSPINHAIDVFDPVTLLELRRAALLCQIFKTSFSRSNPVPRGQATVIRSFVRGKAKPFQQQTIQSDKLPTYLQSFPNLRSARPSKGSSGSGSDIRIKIPIPGSLQINLLFTIRTEQANTHKSDAKLYFQGRHEPHDQPPIQGDSPSPIVRRPIWSAANEVCNSVKIKNGGAERDRTADPLLAKQVLSQLSYSPIQRFNRTG